MLGPSHTSDEEAVIPFRLKVMRRLSLLQLEN